MLLCAIPLLVAWRAMDTLANGNRTASPPQPRYLKSANDPAAQDGVPRIERKDVLDLLDRYPHLFS